MEELYVWIIFIFKCEKELTWEKELKMRSLKEAILKNGVAGYVKASPPLHNGQFYIESRKIIFSGPKFVSNSFD